MTILLVEQETTTGKKIQNALTEGGLGPVISVFTVQEALDTLDLSSQEPNPQSIELIFIDVDTIEEDWPQICLAVSSTPFSKDIFIVLITSDHSPDHLDTLCRSGTVDYLTKPLDDSRIRSRTRVILRMLKSIKEYRDREEEMRKMANKLIQANQRLRIMNELDGLTNVPNRRFFEKSLRSEWRRGAREQEPLSLVMIDIDHFKAFNDTYGHLEGDDCLRSVARATKEALKRPGDILARFGGEEFVAVLANTELEGALQVAEEMRKNVEDLSIPNEAAPERSVVTISLGVASHLPRKEESPDALIKEADHAMYEAKKAGRNTVRPK